LKWIHISKLFILLWYFGSPGPRKFLSPGCRSIDLSTTSCVLSLCLFDTKVQFLYFSSSLTNQDFSAISHKTVGKIAVIWMVELKIFVASPKLDGKQSHHDCCLVLFLSFKLLSFGYLHGRMGCNNRKLPLMNNGFVTRWFSINFDDPAVTCFFLHFA